MRGFGRRVIGAVTRSTDQDQDMTQGWDINPNPMLSKEETSYLLTPAPIQILPKEILHTLLLHPPLRCTTTAATTVHLHTITSCFRVFNEVVRAHAEGLQQSITEFFQSLHDLSYSFLSRPLELYLSSFE